MSALLVHELVGYDRSSGALAFRRMLSAPDLATALRIVQVDPDDPDAVDAYALDRGQVRDLSGLLGLRLPDLDLAFYLECHAGSAA